MKAELKIFKLTCTFILSVFCAVIFAYIADNESLLFIKILAFLMAALMTFFAAQDSISIKNWIHFIIDREKIKNQTITGSYENQIKTDQP